MLTRDFVTMSRLEFGRSLEEGSILEIFSNDELIVIVYKSLVYRNKLYQPIEIIDWIRLNTRKFTVKY